ncbi:MAG: glutamine synthetase III [Cyclobacteriaceae bacterium]|nr:glutamine synthetase III [Cyclobacteriaceae bacterium]MCH8515691.1 glutamine synthetase III [Cyclobacteriaceae bacterium]
MGTVRIRAIEAATTRPEVLANPPSTKLSDFYCKNVFNLEAMEASVSPVVYKELQSAIRKGTGIEAHVADAVAAAMKSWAMGRGVTHYTHWFQPLTGATAEKHDAFFTVSPDGKALESFKGSSLVQQEPDASSFPSGGLRNTFEARGYTAWDPSSPAFIIERGGTKTLCIPTVFVSYTGEALDYKAPLLKSLHALEKAALPVVQEYFDRNVSKITATLGVEQEYFLIDKAFFYARPDLITCGRTVLGHSPSKGQQLDDHYFGSIPSRVHAFMYDFETEALKLGIPITTRHNEVAPSQFECAPVFQEVNLAVDKNQLLMDIMQKVAERHNFKVLMHEKPFAGVNGSGKHNNWSLGTDTGKNLLSPSTKAKENLQFLTFFVNTIAAVHKNADLLRASIASIGNDHRLGANEAPPAIMSVFIGSQLTEVLDELEASSTIKVEKGDNMYIKLGINKIPPILKDNTDRNRTSPFAFTGNKFEFRAVGSSANSSSPMVALNTAMASQLVSFKKAVDALVADGEKKEVAIIKVLRDLIIESKAIRFEKDGYSDEWVKEAEKRGLNNVKTTDEALDFYLTDQAIKLFTDNKVFTEAELRARHEISLEHYTMGLQIESRVLGDMAVNQIIPAAMRYQRELIANLKGLKDLGLDSDTDGLRQSIEAITKHVNTIKLEVEAMIEARKAANKLESASDMAKAYTRTVKSKFDTIRYHVDKLELLVDDEQWPLPKYREMLFMR